MESCQIQLRDSWQGLAWMRVLIQHRWALNHELMTVKLWALNHEFKIIQWDWIFDQLWPTMRYFHPLILPDQYISRCSWQRESISLIPNWVNAITDYQVCTSRWNRSGRPRLWPWIPCFTLVEPATCTSRAHWSIIQWLRLFKWWVPLRWCKQNTSDLTVKDRFVIRNVYDFIRPMFSFIMCTNGENTLDSSVSNIVDFLNFFSFFFFQIFLV